MYYNCSKLKQERGTVYMLQERVKKRGKTQNETKARVPSILLGDVPAQLSASSAVLTVYH